MLNKIVLNQDSFNESNLIFPVYIDCHTLKCFQKFQFCFKIYEILYYLSSSVRPALINFIVNCWTCPFSLIISAVCGSQFTTGLFLILRALSAYLRVFNVSSMLLSAGLTHAIINVWLFPPNESEDSYINP